MGYPDPSLEYRLPPLDHPFSNNRANVSLDWQRGGYALAGRRCPAGAWLRPRLRNDEQRGQRSARLMMRSSPIRRRKVPSQSQNVNSKPMTASTSIPSLDDAGRPSGRPPPKTLRCYGSCNQPRWSAFSATAAKARVGRPPGAQNLLREQVLRTRPVPTATHALPPGGTRAVRVVVAPGRGALAPLEGLPVAWASVVAGVVARHHGSFGSAPEWYGLRRARGRFASMTVSSKML